MKTDPRVPESIRSFHGVADAVKAAGLQTVLELPVTTWPEVPPRDGYDYYTMRLPQIFDPRGSQTRWSYGASKLQPGFSMFVATIRSEFDPDGVAFRAGRLGFDSVLFEKRALPLGEAQRLLTALTAAKPSDCLLYEDADRALVDIGRKAHCAHAAPLQQSSDPLEISLQGKVTEFIDPSFSPPDASGTWASTPDSTLFLPTPAGNGQVTIHITFSIVPSLEPTKRIIASMNGQQLGEFAVKTAPGTVSNIDIKVPADLAPAEGTMPLHLHFDQPEKEVMVSFTDPRTLSEHIQTIKISR